MKKIKNIYVALFSLIAIFYGCKENEYVFGELTVPTEVTITAEIVGKNATNPTGDGTGFVNFTVTAKNAISYVFYFDGKPTAAPSGIITKRFSTVGTNTYTVAVKANGRGGVSATKTIDVKVFSSFEDKASENFLSGANVGDSKKWYWQADKKLHIGLGPVEEDYGNKEFAYEAWWNTIGAWDKEKSCMYNNEFVFTRTAKGLTFEQTVGPAFIPAAYAGDLGVDGDQCHDATVATTMFGVKDVSFAPSSSKAALQGSYAEKPYTGTEFTISDSGFMGWYVGASNYDIISISETEMHIRIIQKGGGFAWYQRFTTTKPVKGVVTPTYTYNKLAWEDNFNTDGAPDPAKWTYDLGANSGWGNNEKQTYTNKTENVKIEGGSLKITAKKDASLGYTSARIKTQGLYKFKYGRVEIKAKLPATKGTWPALWMLGSNFSTVGWPASGEIDIMEQRGDNKDLILGTFHWFDDVANIKSPHSVSYGESVAITNASSEFHIYTAEWTDKSIKIFVDNKQFVEIANKISLPFNADFFMIFNIAMGGNLGGVIDTAFTEDTMEVDYVKVFQ